MVTATNPEYRKDPGDKMGADERIERQTISIGRERTIAEAYRERLDIQNHGPIAFDCDVELELDADFADIFEVRGYARPRRGTLLPIEVTADGGLRLRLRRARRRDRPDVRGIRSGARPRSGPSTSQAGSVVARWSSPLGPGERRARSPGPCMPRESPPRASMRSTPTPSTRPAPMPTGSPGMRSIETDHELINQVIGRSLERSVPARIDRPGRRSVRRRRGALVHQPLRAGLADHLAARQSRSRRAWPSRRWRSWPAARPRPSTNGATPSPGRSSTSCGPAR